MIKSIKKVCSENFFNESAFRIVYFISLFFSGVVFFDIISVILDIVIFIWAFFILKNRLKNKTLNIKYSRIIFLFLLFAIVTTCINISMGFPINFFAGLAIIYHIAVCFFIFYGAYGGTKFSDIKNEIILLCKILLTISTSLVILSFIVLLFGDSFSFEWTFPIIDNYEHYERIIGIVKSTGSVRFTGVFINPNILAFSSVVSIIFCHILYRTNQFFNIEKKWTKILFITLIVSTHFSALILSDSIASFLFLVGYTVLWLFYKMILENKISSMKTILKHGMIFFIGCLLLIFGLFTLRACFQSSASNALDELYSIIMNNNSAEYIDDIRFGRPNHDIRNGSGRRLLLKQAAFIFSKHPLFGIGSTNIVDYGKIYFESGIAFSNFHNGYVSILVCNGIIGFALFMMFLLLILINVIKFFLENCSNLKDTVFVNLFISFLSYLIFALFEKTLLSEINFMGIFFWIILGYIMSFFMEYQKEN